MGKIAVRKRVILPTYKPTDHTPEFYQDSYTGRLIPTAYFLENLEELGPEHWQNHLSADLCLRVVVQCPTDTPATCGLPQYTRKPAAAYYHVHTLVLASQSGFFNQLLGPINIVGHCAKPNSDTVITLAVPHPDVFEPILHWLYHHDDDALLDCMTVDNFLKFYENIHFLKLGREAYDLLDIYIDEAEDLGYTMNIPGVIETY